MQTKTVSEATANRLDAIVSKWDAYMNNMAEYTEHAKKDKEYHDGLLSRRMKEVWARRQQGTYLLGCLAQPPHKSAKREQRKCGGFRIESCCKVKLVKGQQVVRTFQSMVEAAQILGLSYDTLRWRISRGVVYDGIRIIRADETKNI